MTIADNKEGVMMEGMGYNVLIQIVFQVAFEAATNIFIDGLQFNEYQRQAVDETEQNGSPSLSTRA